MQPDGAPSETPVLEAPVDAAPAPAPDAAPETPPSETTWEQAAAEARAAVDAQSKAPEETTPAPDAQETPAEETPPDSRDKGRRSPEEGALDRALNLRMQGKESELSDKAKRLLATYDEQVSAQAITKYREEQTKEAELRQVYLSLEAERMENPAEFASKLVANEGIAIFMNSFKARFPDVSLERPDAPRQETAEEISQQLVREFGKGFERAFSAIGSDAGLSDEAINALRSEFVFGEHPDSAKLGSFLGKAMTQVAAQAGKEAKARATAAETENDALKKELSALKLRTHQPPAHVPSSGGNGFSSGVTNESAEARWGSAVAQAREVVAAG